MTADEGTTPPAAHTALDINVLKYYVGDEPDMLRDFLIEYRKSASQHEQKLTAAMAAGDHAQASLTAHTLKSTSRAAGATRLGDLLAEIEVAATRLDPEAVQRSYEQFTQEYRAVVRRLDELLSVPE